MATTKRTLQIIVDLGGSAKDGLGKLAGGLGSTARIAGGVALGGITALAGAATALGVAALGAFNEFEEGTNALIKGTGASGKSLKNMQDSMLRLSEGTSGVGHDFDVLGSVLAEVNTRTGSTGKSMENLSADILTLSRLTGGDAVKNVQLITRVMGDWGVSMEDSSKLVDQLHGAGQAFGIGVEDLTAKVVQFGAPLRQMGFSLEESIALFGKWEKEGVNAELAIGSLRIAAGKFAREQAEANTKVIGGVESMEVAQRKLDKLRQQLHLTTLKQSEFTDKTRESTRARNEMRISDLTQEIADLEAAMAQGEIRTVQTTGAQKDLKDSLRETFTAIQSAKTETEALAIGMEVFGARAGPDMTAAIREGRFALDDALIALQATSGGLDDAGSRTLTLGERFGILRQQVTNALIPVGEAINNVASDAMPGMERAIANGKPAIDSLAESFQKWAKEDLPEAIRTVRAWSDDQRSVAAPAAELVRQSMENLSLAFGTSTERTNQASGGIGAFIGRLFSLEGVLTAITTATQLYAVVIHGVSNAILIGKGIWDNANTILRHTGGIIGGLVSNWRRIRSELLRVTNAWDRMRVAARAAARAIPRWLRPGSPTPFETGLRGIASAAKTVSAELPNTFTPSGTTAVAHALAGAGGGGGLTLHFTYAPMVSTADRFEAENVLAPLIAEQVRKLAGGGR